MGKQMIDCLWHTYGKYMLSYPAVGHKLYIDAYIPRACTHQFINIHKYIHVNECHWAIQTRYWWFSTSLTWWRFHKYERKSSKTEGEYGRKGTKKNGKEQTLVNVKSMLSTQAWWWMCASEVHIQTCFNAFYLSFLTVSLEKGQILNVERGQRRKQERSFDVGKWLSQGHWGRREKRAHAHLEVIGS